MKKLLFFYVFFPALLAAQPFTGQLLMAFHTCDASCTGFQDHMVQLAESNDGSSWTLVPNFVPYSGSVPDVITRGNKLYLFTPGKVKRYDNSTGTWDAAPVPVSVVDVNGNPVNFVDPSAIVDSAGQIVLFFLNSTGVTGDPAGCQTYPCTKYFNSAVEVAGSDGTQFVMQSGDRYLVTLQNSPQTASDPDIFWDGTKYVLYISEGNSVEAATCSALHGTYTQASTLPSGILTTMGGIPCGIYRSSASQYFTYVHSNVSGNTVIRLATHNDFSSQLNTFTTVMSGPVIGEPATTRTESPSVCKNTFLTSINENSRINAALYPNPFSEAAILQLTTPVNNATFELFDAAGRCVRTETFSGSSLLFYRRELANGIYFFRITSDTVEANGKLLLN
jgi:hypothetical protein